MTNSEKALEKFKNSYNCSQSVFAAYSEKFGIKEKDAFLVASGFGGGIGRTQDICGAISGAIMVLGCRYYDEKNPDSKLIVYEKVKTLVAKFKELYNTVDCLPLTGVDLNKEGGPELFKTLNIHENKCNGFVMDVCNILDEMI